MGDEYRNSCGKKNTTIFGDRGTLLYPLNRIFRNNGRFKGTYFIHSHGLSIFSHLLEIKLVLNDVHEYTNNYRNYNHSNAQECNDCFVVDCICERVRRNYLIMMGAEGNVM